jgi:hypothetical protein
VVNASNGALQPGDLVTVAYYGNYHQEAMLGGTNVWNNDNTIDFTVHDNATDYAKSFTVDSTGWIHVHDLTGGGNYTVTKALPTPVYRFYNATNGSHFYTTSAAERDIVISRWSSVYALEGVGFTVNAGNPNNNAPLYRFYNVRNGSHFYTASAEERDIVIATWPTVYAYEGPTYSVCATNKAGSTPVYRFYNVMNGSHFYTSSDQERDAVIAQWSATYTYEGPAYYLAQ